MQSKVKIAGHPLHPMLVAFPIASYVFTFAALIACAVTLDGFWFRLALIANLVGVVTALLAAVPGSIDYATSVPANSVAKRTGAVHGILNVGALILFAVNLLLLYQQYSAGEPPRLLIGLVLTGGGVVLTLAAGFYGWEMVQRHHVGVQPVADLRTVSHTASEGVIEEAAIEAGTWMDSDAAQSTGARSVTESQVLAQEGVVPDQTYEVPDPFASRPDDVEAPVVEAPVVEERGGPGVSQLDHRALHTSAREWLAEEARAEEARAAEARFDEAGSTETRSAEAQFAERRAQASEDLRVSSDTSITEDLRYAKVVRDLDTGERERLAEDGRITARWEPTPSPDETGDLPRHH